MILVDTPRPVRYRRFKITSHCASTTPGAQGTQELIAFGRSIGLKVRWLQHKGSPKEHFDLFDGAIKRALDQGATCVSPREWVERVVWPKRATERYIEPWYVYMVRARDNSIYIGCSNDPLRRLHEHNNTKKGAKYFRRKNRRPGTLIWTAHVQGGKINAHRVEWWLKRHTRQWKLTYIQKDDQEANECLPDRLKHCVLWVVPLENVRF